MLTTALSRLGLTLVIALVAATLIFIEGEVAAAGPPPDRPTGLNVSVAPGSLEYTATWPAVERATYYKILWRQRGVHSFLPDNQMEVETNSATFSVSNYGEWVVRLEACNAAGCGQGVARQVAVTPAVPENFAVASTPGELSIAAAWDSVEGASSYKLRWRRPGGGFQSGDEVIATATAASLTVSDYGEWVVRLEACNGESCGQGVARQVAVTPAVPENFAVASTPGELSIAAAWDSVEGASSYKLRWRRPGGGFQSGDEVIATATAASLTVSDYGEWVVRLEACNGESCGRPTTLRFAVAPAPEPTPEPTPIHTATPQPTATPTATPAGRGYRGQLAEVILERSLHRPTRAAGERNGPQTANGPRQTPTPTATPMTTSIVYVIDDSGSMDSDFPEVRTALEGVRDATMANTKVALIAFGTNPKSLFGLTDHSSAPWNTHINAFGGKLGGTSYPLPLQNAKTLLDADSANFKKIIFVTDAQNEKPTRAC